MVQPCKVTHPGSMYPKKSREHTLWIIHGDCQEKYMLKSQTQPISQSRTPASNQDTERWDAGNKNQWQNLSRVTYFTLVSFMLSVGHCKCTVQELEWVSPCLISAVWKPSDCSKGYCQHKERKTFAGGILSHASETPTLRSDSSLSASF